MKGWDYMLKTSYYANFRSFPEGAIRVSISLKTPPGAADIHIPELAPDAALLWDYKAGRTNKAGYTLRYTMKLRKLLDSGKLSELFAPLIAESRPGILL